MLARHIGGLAIFLICATLAAGLHIVWPGYFWPFLCGIFACLFDDGWKRWLAQRRRTNDAQVS